MRFHPRGYDTQPFSWHHNLHEINFCHSLITDCSDRCVQRIQVGRFTIISEFQRDNQSNINWAKQCDGARKPTCQLTLAGAPDIKGLRLRMTADEVLALFPGSKDDAELRSRLSKPASPLGVSGFVIRPDKYESKEKFAGINQISLNLLDGRVSSFSSATTARNIHTSISS